MGGESSNMATAHVSLQPDIKPVCGGGFVSNRHVLYVEVHSTGRGFFTLQSTLRGPAEAVWNTAICFFCFFKNIYIYILYYSLFIFHVLVCAIQ